MELNKIHNIYFIGIGGIGMSALARYFKALGKTVAGYDRTATNLTNELITEGFNIHFVEDINLIPDDFLEPDKHTLIVYTPAVPQNHNELVYFRQNKFNIMKRAEVLGLISENKKAIAVAGTHGKTTITTMIAHILKQAENDCTAFLGGISKNYESNLLLSENSECVVVEADEFDRSFLFLSPTIAVITSMDADHLDIYGDQEELVKSFNQFAHKIKTGGVLFYKKGLNLKLTDKEKFASFTYAIEKDADYKAVNIRVVHNTHYFDIVTPQGIMENLTLGVPGKVNIENITAAVAVAYYLGITPPVIRGALASYSGVRRRFDYHINLPDLVYIDDYAHHPEELKATISSVKTLYKGRKITGIFQPHLYSRTRDFADEFAHSLELLDELFLLDIYPAREQPIEGVTSSLIFHKVQMKHKTLCSKDEVVNLIMDAKIDVLLTMGAGDIDTLTGYLTKMLLAKKDLNERMKKI